MWWADLALFLGFVTFLLCFAACVYQRAFGGTADFYAPARLTQGTNV